MKMITYEMITYEMITYEMITYEMITYMITNEIFSSPHDLQCEFDMTSNLIPRKSNPLSKINYICQR